jgi:hypothetical protein
MKKTKMEGGTSVSATVVPSSDVVVDVPATVTEVAADSPTPVVVAATSEDVPPAESATGELTIAERFEKNPALWAAVIVPAVLIIVGIILGLYFGLRGNSSSAIPSNAPQFKGFQLTSGTFCRPVRYRYTLSSGEYSPVSAAVGGTNVTGSQPTFTASESTNASTWQRSINLGAWISNTMTLSSGIWVDVSANPCGAKPVLEWTGYAVPSEPVEGYFCEMEYRISYFGTADTDWSNTALVGPPVPASQYPGIPRFRVRKVVGLPTSFTWQRAAVSGPYSTVTNMQSLPPDDTFLYFQDPNPGLCGSQLQRKIAVPLRNTVFYINRNEVAWWSVTVEAKVWVVAALLIELERKFATPAEVTVGGGANVSPRFLQNVKFNLLVGDFVNVSIPAPTNFDGTGTPGGGTQAVFRVTTNTNAVFGELNPPNNNPDYFPNLNGLLGFPPTFYPGPSAELTSFPGQTGIKITLI